MKKQTRIKNGYEQILKHNRWVYTHHYIWSSVNGDRRRNYQIHHINGNRKDNNIKNLVELQTKYHRAMHNLIKILGITMLEFYRISGMLPSDTPEFYEMINMMCAQYHVEIPDDSTYQKRRSRGGTGLSHNDSAKRKLIQNGRIAIKKGNLPYERSTKVATENCKKSVIKHFGTLKKYYDVCKVSKK